MKKFYFISLLAFLCIGTQAQVSVTATAGTPGPSSYTTLQEAVLAVNNGVHQGNITIAVNAGTTETLSSTFVQSSTGAASYTAIAIQPGTGVAATVTGDIAGALLDITGADNISINGLNAGGSSLIFSNTNTTAAASCIRFTDGATNNTIQNCSLLSAAPSATSGTVVFGGTVATGNSNNSIINNRIADASTGTPANAIYASGTAGQENSSNTISGNFIYNYFQPLAVTAGILLAANNTQWTIQNNRLYQTTARVFSGGFIHRGIQVAGGDGYTISGNTIGGATETGTGLYDISGAATRFTGIELSAGFGTASSVQGNRVYNMQIGTTSGAGAPQGIFCGIYINSGNVNVGTITGNTIGAEAGNGAIRLVPSTGGSVITGITYNGSGIADIRNNTVGSIDFMPALALSGNAFALQVLGAGATVTIENNTLGGSSPNSISIGVKGTTTGNGVIRGIHTNNNGTLGIRNNLIQNLTHNSNSSTALFRAIECQTGTVTITGNTINNIAAEGTSTSTATHEGIGILVSTALPNIVIDSNTISNLSLTNTGALATILSGIYIGSLNTGARITRNKLYGFSNAATGVSATAPPVAAAIYLRDVAAGGEMFVANNMIALGSGQTTNTSFIGIWNQVNPATGYNEYIYYNSINIEGTVAAGAQPSFAFYRGNFTATFTGPTVDIRNNIFINTRAGGTGAHFAIANSYGAASSATGWGANASDYNVLNADAATVGYWSGNQSFDNWKLNSLSDNNSLHAVAVNFVDAANDLHLVANTNAAIEGKGTPIATVPADIDNNPRDAALPDLGADELLNIVPVRIEFFRGQKQVSKNLLEWKANISGNAVQFIIERSTDGRNFETIGNVTAASFEQSFSFYDASPAAGLNYYRLKMTEQGGSIAYSAVITLASDVKDMDISIRPNYIRNGIANLYIQSGKAMQATIHIADVSGKIIITRSMTIPAGAGTYPLNVSVLAKGAYYISVRDNKQVTTQRIVVE